MGLFLSTNRPDQFIINVSPMLAFRIRRFLYIYWQIIQVTKREEAFLCVIRNTFLLLRDDLRNLKECAVKEIRLDKFFSSFRVCMDHQVRHKKNLRSFVMT